VDLLDAASIRGVLATVRHRIRRYPAVVIDGHLTLTGLGFDRVDEVVDRTVAEARGRPDHQSGLTGAEGGTARITHHE
jgi:hypothetical protein